VGSLFLNLKEIADSPEKQIYLNEEFFFNQQTLAGTIKFNLYKG
jgi:hypothetical protein